MDGAPERPALDGGWAWMVLLAASVMMLCINGTDRAQGVTYRLVLTRLAGGPLLSALSAGLQLSLRYMLAFLGAHGERRFGARITVIGGALLQTTGVLLSLLATEGWHFVLTFGIVGGVGAAISYSACVITLRAYFEKHRLLAFGTASVFMCIGHAIHPPVLGWATHLVGYQGFVLAWAGIVLQVCVSGALCRPLEANYKSSTTEGQVISDLQVQESNSSESQKVVVDESSSLIHDFKDDSPKNTSLRTFYIFLVSVSLCTACYYPPMVFIVDILVRRGDTLETAATLTGLANLLDVILKVVMVAILHRPTFQPYSRLVFSCAILVSGASCAGLGAFSGRWTTYLLYSTASMGVSCITMLYLVILGDVVSKEYFPNAVSTLGILQGIAHLVAPFIYGFLRDWSGGYTVALACSSIGNFIGFLLLFIDYICNCR